MPQKNTENDKQKTVPADDHGLRLDRWLRRLVPELTQGQIEKYLRAGDVRVNGVKVASSHRLAAGELVRLPPYLRQPDLQKPKNTNISSALRALILFEDEDLLALNKPSGLAVQGGTGIKTSLDEQLKDYCPTAKLVHRLDRDTSGVLMVAKNSFAAAALTEAFRLRETKKVYWALTDGVPARAKGKIKEPLLKKGERMIIDPEGQEAITTYRRLGTYKDQIAFLEVMPETGRTHQIRVHLQSLGTPIVGDPLYGREAMPDCLEKGKKTLHLHARSIVIPHPRGTVFSIMAPLPKSFQQSFDLCEFTYPEE
jgi:23S rRNA pseudouridine955/2504/2580 synthase